MSDTKRVTVYTDAPPAYDYGYMRDDGPAGAVLTFGGVPMERRTGLRTVSTEDTGRLRDYQIPRYRSGLYVVLTGEDLESWLAEGRAIRREKE